MWYWSYVNLVCKFVLVIGFVANQVPKFTITYTKFYLPVVTLSTEDNTKVLKQLESGFKRLKKLE